MYFFVPCLLRDSENEEYVNWATSSLAKSPTQTAKLYLKSPEQPQKTADILRRHLQFSREITSEERAQEFHTDDVTLPRSGWSF